MEEKDNKSEFKEEIVMINRPTILREGGKPIKITPKLLGKRILLGKVLKNKIISIDPQPEHNKKSNAFFLIETIMKTYWASKWKDQVNILKYSKTGFNQKRADFRNLCMKLNNSIKYHQYLYLIKLFNNMDKLPTKPNIIHDNNYGKIKIVDKNFSKKKGNDEKGESEGFQLEFHEEEYKPENEDNKEINDNKKNNIIDNSNNNIIISNEKNNIQEKNTTEEQISPNKNIEEKNNNETKNYKNLDINNNSKEQSNNEIHKE